jgi:hypothetical protein
MTNIPIPGKIISIEVEEDAPFGYAEYSDNAAGAKTVIEPTGNKLSVIKLSHDNSNAGVGFSLSDDFNIGDVIEAYSDDGFQYSIYLSATGNNNGIVLLSSIRRAARMRKIFSETGYDWLALM